MATTAEHIVGNQVIGENRVVGGPVVAEVSTLSPRPNWGAIWAGVFTFISIWSVFGLLGMAIFASVANPGVTKPVSGMGAGMSVWAIILTIIAMWVGGMATGRLAGINNRRDGVMHGMIMFGLSVMAVLLIAAISGGAVASAAGSEPIGGTHSPYMLTMFADLGWAGFISLFLGWLAAMAGASAGIKRRMEQLAGTR